MQPENLNELRIADDGFPEDWRRLADFGTQSGDARIAVHFRNIEEHLLRHIRESQLVVGCIAWLTCPRILRALAEVPHGVSIVVQKEDFLRPDVAVRDNWKDNLRQLYDALKPPPGRPSFGGLLGRMSVCGDWTIDPVRCVGNHNSEKKPAFPRMHNKFLVLCDISEDPFEARAHTVWSGSFNFSENAGRSLENALIVKDTCIAQAYVREWEQILALSEPLDWESEWCQPEWRIGT